MASGGESRVGFIAGEAGIGKTRLLRELGALAQARGFAVHIGRATEGSPVPFHPLRQALAAPLARKHQGRRGRRARDMREISRFLRGEVRSPIQKRADVVAMESAGGLGSIIVGATLDLARTQPMLLIIDDLQWADGATLETFEALAFGLADSVMQGQAVPLLLVAGVRVPEPERVARTLARLQRETVCETLPLSPLDEDEVAELLTDLLEASPTHQMVETARRATAGNPLFLQELVRHLRRVGGLRRQGRFVTIAAGSVDLVLPADVRTVVRDRTMRLEESSRYVLTIGAALGDPFELSAVRALVEHAGGPVDALVDEWIRTSLVVSDGIRVYFAHPLIRQGLLAEMPVSRRRELSLRIAQTLGTMPVDDDRRLELAHHLILAGPLADPRRVVSECTRAADIASTRHAWVDAARFYEAALHALDRTRPPPTAAKRSQLHLRAGFAHYRDQDAGACLAQFDAAIEWARSARAPLLLTQALLGRIRARFTLVSASYGERIETSELEALIGRVTRRDPVLAGFAWSEMAQVLWTARRPIEARTFAERGLAIGLRRKVPMVVAEAHRALSLISSQDLDPRGALEHLETGLSWARRGREAWIESQILQRMVLPLLWLGRSDRLESLVTEATASSQVIQDWGDHSLAHGGLTCWAVARGEFERAEGELKETLRLLRRSRYPWAGPTALPAIALARALIGAWSEADAALALLVEPGEIFEAPGTEIMGMAFVLREVLVVWERPADRALVRERLEPLAGQLAEGLGDDLYAIGLGVAVVELASMLGSRTLAEAMYPRLVRAHERGMVLATGWVGLVSRALGTAAAVLERWDEAERWFEEALTTSRELQLRTEAGRTAVAYARALATRNGPADGAHALDLLAIAVPQLRALGMRPTLGDALELAATLMRTVPSARDGSSHRLFVADGPRLAIMFTDIEGSTSAYERLGDAAGRAIVRAHDEIVGDVLRGCDGTLMKHTGDGIEAAFPTVTTAVEAAVRMQQGFARHSRRNPGRVLRVRIGINVGEPLAEAGDLFGTAINVAARVCARAKGGEILVTEAARQLVDVPGIGFRARGRATLRGIRTPMRLFQIVW